MRVQINKSDNSVKLIENSESAIPIKVETALQHFINSVENIQQIETFMIKTLPAIEKIAVEAYSRERNEVWSDLQKLLYIWNIQDFRKSSETTNSTFLFNLLLRNKILEVENQFAEHKTFESFTHFTPKLAVREMFEQATSHRVNMHPLLEYMAENGLSKRALTVFLENYYIDNRVFHLFIAQQSMSSPMEMRVELYQNLYDELGNGRLTKAHPLLFLRNFNSIEKPNEIIPLPEALYLFNSEYYASALAGNYHYGAGGLGFLEITMPKQMTMILEGLRKTGLPEEDLEFWKVHIAIDEMHGKAWFQEMERVIKTHDQAIACLNGGWRLIEARAILYDGIWEYLINHKLIG